MHLKGSITITMFQLLPRAPRQPAQGAQTRPPLLSSAPPGTGGISPAIRSGVRGGAGPQTPQHSPGAGPALQGGGWAQADPSPSWAEPWSVCLRTVDWVDSSLPVTSREISRMKFARFPKMILQQIHSKLRLEFQTQKSVFTVSHIETPYGSGLHKNSFLNLFC